METSPLLARRVLPVRERLQKSLLVLFVTAIALGCAWVFTAGSLFDNTIYVIACAAAALLGLGLSLYFWFKKEEMAHTKEDGRAVRDRIDDDRQGRGWTSRIGYNLRRLLGTTIVLAGALIALAGLGVFGLQVYEYLRFGEWGSISLLRTLAPYVPWLTNPQSWPGLYKIVSKAFGLMPLSLALILLGWLVAGFGSAVKQRVTR